jgi:hypothetical protein
MSSLRLLATFDTAGEVIFATVSTLTHQVFIGLPNMNHAYFRLRQQYHIWWMPGDGTARSGKVARFSRGLSSLSPLLARSDVAAATLNHQMWTRASIS